MRKDLSAVTGAFGYTGSYIARHLLAQGRKVITLVSHPGRGDGFSGRIPIYRLNFDDPSALTAALKGVDTLYNTYWVRFERNGVSFEQAIVNTQTLLTSARSAGVRRIVHLSVSNPSLDSPLPYFRGKARVEALIQASGLSYAILRPTLIFGLGDILINNIAYLLRRFPLFAIPGSGEYRLQPISVEDLAQMATQVGEASQDMIQDAAGTEVYTFNQFVRLIAGKVKSRARIIHLSPGMALPLISLIGVLKKDVLLTRDELTGLSAELLLSKQPPTGATSFQAWLEQNAALLGRSYASELERHFPRM